jgi:hypothetical protein
MSSDEADNIAEDHAVTSLRAEGQQDSTTISADFLRFDGVVSDTTSAAGSSPLAPTVTPSPLEGHEERRDRELNKQNVRERKMTLEPPTRIAPSPLGPGEAAEQARERKRKRLGAMSLGPNLEDDRFEDELAVWPESDDRGSLFGISEAPRDEVDMLDSLSMSPGSMSKSYER